jgi:hypothetical protein
MNRIATLAFVVAMLGAGAPVAGQGKPAPSPTNASRRIESYTSITGTTRMDCR